MIYINNGDHDNPHEPPQKELEGCDVSQNTLYSHHIDLVKDLDEFQKLHYCYQHFQDSEKMQQMEPESEPISIDNDSLYPYVNNDIEYGLFEDIVDSYYLDSQIKDDFQCDHGCYSQHRDLMIDSYSTTCTHDYHHITQSIQDLLDTTQQNDLHSMEENTSSFTDDADTLCDFSIVDHNSDSEDTKHMHFVPNTLAFTHKENTHTEIFLVIHTYNTTTLTIKILSHLKTNIRYYYNKNY